MYRLFIFVEDGVVKIAYIKLLKNKIYSNLMKIKIFIYSPFNKRFDNSKSSSRYNHIVFDNKIWEIGHLGHM